MYRNGPYRIVSIIVLLLLVLSSNNNPIHYQCLNYQAVGNWDRVVLLWALLRWVQGKLVSRIRTPNPRVLSNPPIGLLLIPRHNERHPLKAGLPLRVAAVRPIPLLRPLPNHQPLPVEVADRLHPLRVAVVVVAVVDLHLLLVAAVVVAVVDLHLHLLLVAAVVVAVVDLHLLLLVAAVVVAVVHLLRLLLLPLLRTILRLISMISYLSRMIAHQRLFLRLKIIMI